MKSTVRTMTFQYFYVCITNHVILPPHDFENCGDEMQTFTLGIKGRNTHTRDDELWVSVFNILENISMELFTVAFCKSQSVIVIHLSTFAKKKFQLASQNKYLYTTRYNNYSRLSLETFLFHTTPEVKIQTCARTSYDVSFA